MTAYHEHPAENAIRLFAEEWKVGDHVGITTHAGRTIIGTIVEIDLDECIAYVESSKPVSDQLRFAIRPAVIGHIRIIN